MFILSQPLPCFFGQAVTNEIFRHDEGAHRRGNGFFWGVIEVFIHLELGLVFILGFRLGCFCSKS